METFAEVEGTLVVLEASLDFVVTFASLELAGCNTLLFSVGLIVFAAAADLEVVGIADLVAFSADDSVTIDSEAVVAAVVVVDTLSVVGVIALSIFETAVFGSLDLLEEEFADAAVSDEVDVVDAVDAVVNREAVDATVVSASPFLLDDESVIRRDADRGPGFLGLLGPDFFFISGLQVATSGLEISAFNDATSRPGVLLPSSFSSGAGFEPVMLNKHNLLRIQKMSEIRNM